MKGTSKSLKVFDFSEEDELPEIAAIRIMRKFRKPSVLDKHNTRGSAAHQSKIHSEETGDVRCGDVDAFDSDRNRDYIDSDHLETGSEAMSDLDDVSRHNSSNYEQCPTSLSNKLQPGSLEMRYSSPKTAPLEKSQIDSAILESPPSHASDDVIPDTDEGVDDSSPSASSEVGKDGDSLDEPSSDHCFAGWDMREKNMEVSVRPDYVVYHDTYCTESLLLFSSSGITVKGSTACRNEETFRLQWGIDDIVVIESQWFGKLETAMITLRILSRNADQAENAFGTTGVEELKFAVVDTNWYEKQEEIMSLDVRYSALWNVVFDSDIGGSEDGFVGRTGICFPKSYFPDFDEPFEEVIYPKGDPDAVSISKRDVDLLQPEVFINDTIIDFYIKYLKNKIHPEERSRFHFFNSFFFRKLADLDKDPFSAFEGRAAFQRVRKWTRKVNLFEKDYIFIPVNFNYHWSLIVICHPGEVANFEDKDVKKSLSVPCILHMDSIKGSHTGLKDLVQSYLWEEWKEKKKETSEDIASKFSNLRFVPLELPQQENSYDCGLFLLHYVELFLEEAPDSFNPFKITKVSNFLNVDWFPPFEASLKRVLIQRLIYELLENRSRDISPAFPGEKPFRSAHPESLNDSETGIEYISERCSPRHGDGNFLCSQSNQGVEVSLLQEFSSVRSQCATNSGVVLGEYFEPGVTVGFDRSASFNEFKSAMSSMEEDNIEAAGHFNRPSTQIGSYQLRITPEACAATYSRSLGAKISWNLENPVRQATQVDNDSSPETSNCASDDSFKVAANDDTPVTDILDLKEKTGQKRSASMENTECTSENYSFAGDILDVPDSQQSADALGGPADADAIMSGGSTRHESSHQVHDTHKDGDNSSHDVQIRVNDSASEGGSPAGKKARLTHPLRTK